MAGGGGQIEGAKRGRVDCESSCIKMEFLHIKWHGYRGRLCVVA